MTARDRLVLEGLAELRVAALPQIAAWLGVAESTAARRLSRLADAGLVDRPPRVGSGARPARITPAGLKRIDSPIGAPGQKLDEYRHDIGVAWLWSAARAGSLGGMTEVLSERRMRSHDGRLDRMTPGEQALASDGRFHGVGRLPGDDWRDRRHYPDLMVRTRTGHTIALELELTAKGSRRLEAVMSAYRADPRIDAVLYLVPDARLERAVNLAAERAGVSRLVHVRRLAPGGIPGVDTPAARRRTRGRESGAIWAARRGAARSTGRGDGRGAARSTRRGNDRGAGGIER